MAYSRRTGSSRPQRRRAGSRLIRAALLAWVSLSAADRAGAQTTSVIVGEVIDERTRRPIADVAVGLVGTERGTFTDARGAFRLEGVESGVNSLRIRHVGYGERTVEVRVDPGALARMRVVLSETAVALEALEVEALTQAERTARGAGYARNRVTRSQIEGSEGTNMTLPDILRQHVPSVRVRRVENVVGSPICIELRTIRTMGRTNPCLSPAVYLDGVPITNPTHLYGILDPRVIESLEVVPAAESGVRFGSGALYGALLIETRRPGAVDDEGRRLRPPQPNFDWSVEARSHPTGRVFVSSFLGNALGAGLGFLAADQCLSLRKPSNDRLVSDCEAAATLGVAAAALVLPAITGSIASAFAGRTDRSQGRLAPAAVGAAMAIVPGYALVLSGQRNGSGGLEFIGYGLITIGAPVAITAADYLFRKLRGPETPN